MNNTILTMCVVGLGIIGVASGINGMWTVAVVDIMFLFGLFVASKSNLV